MTKPKETEATEKTSPSEPVETRLAADGGDKDPDDRAIWFAELCRDLRSRGDLVARALEYEPTMTALATEVRRLREERDLFRTASEAAELRIVELRAKLARVEALPAKWRDDLEDDCQICKVACADELMHALRDEVAP